ncbi:MAG TPA: ABC transporter substrate-binding protein [Hyphomicrobiaceae bacterium]
MLTSAKLLASALLAIALLAGTADARTVKWARSGDSLTLDPHAQNEGVTHALAHHIYEPLIIRDYQGKPLPALAESWELTSDPTVWEFKLRRGVKFHDGTPFTVDDVIFSYERAMQPTSDMKSLLSSVDKLIRVDDYTLQIKTKGPNPLLPANLTDLFIMSKAWAEKNNAVKVQDFKNKEENYAVRHANGTGPFVLVSREPDVKTVMKRNENYWGKSQMPAEITELVYLPIKSDATRVAALLSGEVDFVQDVPVQDIQRLQSDENLRVVVGPENRAIFLGLNVGDPELKTSNIKGRNPFADKRVRHAINMAINRQAIQRVVMRGQSIPTGIIAPPGVNGYTKELDVIPPNDVEKAKQMLAEAGYPDGFSVTLHCPNDRYVNDEAICQAVVGQLAQIGIQVNLVSQSKSLHFPIVQKDEADFYLLGWGVPTFDSQYIFSYLYHTKTDKEGGWNGTRYSNPKIDEMTASLSRETDLVKRNQTIAEMWKILQDETIYIPIHIQTLAYAMKPDLDIPVDISNQPKLKFLKIKKQQNQ